jgi:hypothetical protein
MINITFTHYDKGNCRKYFKGIDKNIYCQYDNESDYYICSQDGEPSHKVYNVKEITNEIHQQT